MWRRNRGFYCRKEKDRKKDETARHRDDEETENYGLKTKKEQERKEKMVIKEEKERQINHLGKML